MKGRYCIWELINFGFHWRTKMINDKKDFCADVRIFGMLDRFALQQLNKSSRLKCNTYKYQTRKVLF